MFFDKRLNSLSSLLEETVFTVHGKDLPSADALAEILSYFSYAHRENKKIFVIGNGGSCGIASHHVVDLINVLKLKAYNLSDNNLITCMGNDYGYRNIYSKPLEVLADQGDLLIAISSSGNSENIINCCKTIREKEGKVITLSGFESSNNLRRIGDVNIWTGVEDYGLVETAHFFILHTLVDFAAKELKTFKLKASV